MDIDEFLDRELSDLGHDSSYSSAQPNTQPARQPEEQQAPQAEDSSPILESIKSNLSKGNLEEAEQAYIQLWRVLMQQKIKWNRGIYEQIFMLSRQFLATLDQAFNETKSKSGQISELIGRGRNALHDKKKDMAIRIYGQIQEINNSIPNVFFEEKKILKDQIEDFYKELSNATENELIQKVSELVQQINQIMEKISASVSSNDIAAADYSKCIELYNQIPEGFLRQKNPVGVRLLEIYKSLSISSEMFELQKQLGSRPIVPREMPRNFSAGSQPPSHFSRERKHSSADKPRFPPAMPQRIPAGEARRPEISQGSGLLKKKREMAKKNIKKGFYNEAWKNIEDALDIDPGDAEAITLKAKIKTLQ
ncbi:MAG TPA: hypothetical protein VJI52_05090 [Candidatus Nanoarchaeia archaeon]|nr:hypothetical protein [Candidatus Nanoarchaeia archaeon]